MTDDDFNAIEAAFWSDQGRIRRYLDQVAEGIIAFAMQRHSESRVLNGRRLLRVNAMFPRSLAARLMIPPSERPVWMGHIYEGDWMFEDEYDASRGGPARMQTAAARCHQWSR